MIGHVKRIRTGGIIVAVLAIMWLGGVGGGTPAKGAPQHWAKGFNFTTWSPGAYAGAPAVESLQRLQATGANAVALIPTWYQSSPDATTIAPDPDQSPTDESITAIVGTAKAAGLKVFLRPVVDEQGGTSRLDFKPSSPAAWFKSYRTFINHYAELAQRLGVELFSVGHEYHQLDGPRYAASWRRVIAGVRRRYLGSLTYGANNADAWTHNQFWDDLDVIGIDAYFQLSNGATPGVDEIVDRWHAFTDTWGTSHHYLDSLAALSARYDKPIVFTEIGYPSTANALVAPWVKGGGPYDGGAQQRAFAAAFRALAGEPWFDGMYIWEWSADPAAGGAGDGGHTPQGKPAEATIRRVYSEGAAAPRSGPPIGLCRVSLARGALRVRGAVGGRARGRALVVFAVLRRKQPTRVARTARVRRGRFSARLPLPPRVRSEARVSRGTLAVSYRGTRGLSSRLARFSLSRARLDATGGRCET